MASPYLGEIRCFGFNFAPVGWAFCNGQLLPIAQYSALFNLIGTTYGGDGQTTFALPDLRGRSPMHWGNGSGGFNTTIGQQQGTEAVTLTTSQMPAHSHVMTADQVGSGGVPEKSPTPTPNTFVAVSNPDALWVKTPSAISAQFANNTIGSAGGSQPHDNVQPFLTANFCIALAGIYPTP